MKPSKPDLVWLVIVSKSIREANIKPASRFNLVLEMASNLSKEHRFWDREVLLWFRNECYKETTGDNNRYPFENLI